MAYNDNIKTFKAISKHLEMEDECQKSLSSSNVSFVAMGCKPKGKRPFLASRPKKIHEHLETPNLRNVLLRRKRLKAIERRI